MDWGKIPFKVNNVLRRNYGKNTAHIIADKHPLTFEIQRVGNNSKT